MCFKEGNPGDCGCAQCKATADDRLYPDLRKPSTVRCLVHVARVITTTTTTRTVTEEWEGGVRISQTDNTVPVVTVVEEEESTIDETLQCGRTEETIVVTHPQVITRTWDPPEAETDSSIDHIYTFTSVVVRDSSAITERRRLAVEFDISLIEGLSELDQAGNPIVLAAKLYAAIGLIKMSNGLNTTSSTEFTAKGSIFDGPSPSDAAAFDSLFAPADHERIVVQ